MNAEIRSSRGCCVGRQGFERLVSDDVVWAIAPR